MLISTPAQFLVLALVLVAGWLLGLASHPGGGKWKARYLAERDAHAANRKAAETQVAEAKRRSTELECENGRLAKAAPLTAATIQPARAARPAYPAGEKRGWFDWGDRPVR